MTDEVDKRSAPDFIDLERFMEETRMSKGQIKKIIKERESNGANFFLHQVSLTLWMFSPSLFNEWKERRSKTKKGENK